MWAEVDPIEAEALARRVTEPRERNFVLYLACREMWRQDVDRALRLAHSLPPDAAVGNRDEALAALAAGVAQSDPERALGIAADIHSEFNHGEFSREVALQAIITAMAHRNLS